MKEKQLDGIVRTYVDEDMKQSIIIKLLKKIFYFPIEETKRAVKGENGVGI
ncbi:helix-turn-helix domain-containing protein [Faecalicatena contorta]|uniref:helix-turn-helix domain-containing protein n=1 Tax=Faecalicatena contorta TaxID=39482 RepID=UPI0030472ABC|nr:helix-turn-helix domain-containing protein [Faecalicatena contorta]